MVESKPWDWAVVEDGASWETPASDVYYLVDRWKRIGYKKFLDLGCGIGRHALLFAKAGFDITCFDLDQYALDYTEKLLQKDGYSGTFVFGDMLSLPFKDNSFDCILGYHILSHTDTEGFQKSVAELYRILVPGGECYLTLNSSHDTIYMAYPKIDEYTVMATREGPEYMVPHYLIDYDRIYKDFSAFEIVNVTQVQEFWTDQEGATHDNWHYQLLVRKK